MKDIEGATEVVRKPLTLKQKVFVAEYIRTKNGTKAALAVQPNQTVKSASITGARVRANASVQQAIDDALAKHQFTPDFAVARIGKIADMTEEEPSAALKANERLLELHGWRRNEKPIVQVEVNGFFKRSRDLVEGEVVESKGLEGGDSSGADIPVS